MILYGSYARGDFKANSDIDIMILLDMEEVDLKSYSQKLSYMTYDFNLDHDFDIKPIAKGEAHFKEWVVNLNIMIKGIYGSLLFASRRGKLKKYRLFKN